MVDRNRGFVEKHKLKFEVLRDEGNAIASAYGLRWALPDDLRALYQQFGIDLAESQGEDSWTLPMPARFIIGTDGVVRYARTDPDYTRRPEPEETIAALQQLDD